MPNFKQNLDKKMDRRSDEQFFKKLEKQAKLQASLSAQKILPKRSESLMSLVGRHSWQFLLALSWLTTLIFYLLL